MSSTFSYLGGEDGVMDGVIGNGTSGVYGAYSGCSANQRLAFAMDQYYKKNGKSADACGFSGAATTKSATTASACSSQLKAAGTAGTGTVSGTLNAGSTATGSGSSSGATSSGAAGVSTSPPGCLHWCLADRSLRPCCSCHWCLYDRAVNFK
ncbi:hypothetical protein N7494_009751 [Penicillium frequentans]|uniref:X8 domain-containing protein n=1 Tax=Penicillium frequentans TaxID=3151616 RepID=A0AAD6CQL6_9EURO|nr:hypothetical protein N7494_009751 [Penicillium glabrum]